MRNVAILLMLVLAGCSAADRQVTLHADKSELQWPFDPPAWAEAAFRDQPPAAETYAGKAKLLVGAEFITLGPLADHFANLFNLRTRQRVVLDTGQAASLKLLIREIGDSARMISPRILLYETQPAHLGIVQPPAGGGYRFCCQCFAEQDDLFDVRFTVEIARPGIGETWDMEKSWRLEDRQLLKPGQSVLCHGGPDEDGHPMLILVTFLNLHDNDES